MKKNWLRASQTQTDRRHGLHNASESSAHMQQSRFFSCYSCVGICVFFSCGLALQTSLFSSDPTPPKVQHTHAFFLSVYERCFFFPVTWPKDQSILIPALLRTDLHHQGLPLASYFRVFTNYIYLHLDHPFSLRSHAYTTCTTFPLLCVYVNTGLPRLPSLPVWQLRLLRPEGALRRQGLLVLRWRAHHWRVVSACGPTPSLVSATTLVCHSL